MQNGHNFVRKNKSFSSIGFVAEYLPLKITTQKSVMKLILEIQWYIKKEDIFPGFQSGVLELAPLCKIRQSSR